MFQNLLATVSALALLLFTACSNADNNGGGTNGNLLVGANGGTVSVPSGPLQGASLVIPAGAVVSTNPSALVFVEVREGQASAEPGWGAVGPVADWTPSGQSFASPLTMTLPFDPALMPRGLPDSEVVVKVRDNNGIVRNLTPSSVDRANGLVTAQLTEIGAAWVAVPVVDPAVNTVDLRDYLPLGAGDRYEFTNGLVITVESGIRNAPALAFAAPSGLRVESFLFAPDGSLSSNGWGGPGFEIFHPGDLQRAPALPVIDELFTGSAPWELRVPPSVAIPNFTGQTQLESLVARVEPTEAEMLTGFADVIQLITRRVWIVDSLPVQAEELEFLWLSRGVGPVGFLDPVQQEFSLERAVVGGQTIVPVR